MSKNGHLDERVNQALLQNERTRRAQEFGLNIIPNSSWTEIWLCEQDKVNIGIVTATRMSYEFNINRMNNHILLTFLVVP